MKHIKKFNHVKKFNEALISFNDGDYQTSDYYKELFTTTNYNTEITIDLEYYVDIALKKLFKYCEDYGLKPSREIISELVEDVKEHTKEYILYSDQTYINFDEEFDFIISYLNDLLKLKQPEEYRKIDKHYKTKQFKI